MSSEYENVIRKLISDLESTTYETRDDTTRLYGRAEVVVRNLFGASHPLLDNLKRALRTQLAGIVNDEFLRREWGSRRKAVLNVLLSALDELELQRPSRPAQKAQLGADPRRVFVVHGHDRTLLAETARILTDLGLEPIILSEQPSSGMTVIEKLEAQSDVGFAVVLASADDFGDTIRNPSGNSMRARQNVIFELGYFTAKLGRRNTVLVVRAEGGPLELPSNLAGIVYLRADGERRWALGLVRELRAAGFSVDANRIG